MKLHKLAWYGLCIMVGYWLWLSPVQAAARFNPHRIISDDDMTDYTRMSLSSIQSFLSKQGGILASYAGSDVDGISRSAAEMIYNASYRYQLNPQFIIAHIQKESSLITGNNQALLDWALGFGVCDGCSKDNPSVVKYKGFAKQIDAAANKIRNSYLADLADRNSTISGWGVGVTKTTLDGIAITPQNNATAVLYTYTPWLGYHGGDSSVGGNSLFFDIIENFFPNRSSSYITYPNLTLLQDSTNGSVYKIEDGELRPITSYTALLANYDPSKIITVDEATLNRYDEGDPISFPKFILVQGPTGGIYLIDQDHKRRAITSAEIFHRLGYNPEEVLPISSDDLAAVPENPPLTEADKYPVGALLQNQTTGAILYLDTQASLHPVWSKDILDNRYKGYPIYTEPAATLSKYESGEPIQFADGTLLKIPERDTVYVVDNGKKRPITSAEVLDQFGGFGNVTLTSKALLKLHPQGKAFTLKQNKKKSKD